LGLVGLPDDLFQLRANALMQIPEGEYWQLVQMPDEYAREQRIQAIERAYERSGSAIMPEDADPLSHGLRKCALPLCIVRFAIPRNSPRKMYCCDDHRKQDYERRNTR
jgi:hypothetical protein